MPIERREPRPVTADDLPFLWSLLSAAAVDAGLGPLDPVTTEASPFDKYLARWGRIGDAGVVAHDETGQRIGAAWYRLFPAEQPGYGFIADNVPELSIRVLAAYRGMGIGGALLGALERLAHAQGYRALSLSVDRRNPARRLYERQGFRDAGIAAPSDSSVTMLKHW